MFNSPGTPQFQRVSVPLVIGTGVFIGLIFFAIMMIALRALHKPVEVGAESFIGKTGTIKAFHGESGQAQVAPNCGAWKKPKGPKRSVRGIQSRSSKFEV